MYKILLYLLIPIICFCQAYNPRDVNVKALWYYGGSVATTDDSVDTWGDLSGNSHDAIGDTTTRPVLAATGVVFDGSDDFLSVVGHADVWAGTGDYSWSGRVYSANWAQNQLFINTLYQNASKRNSVLINADRSFRFYSVWASGIILHDLSTPAGGLTNGQTYTFTLSCDRDDSTRAYVDGIEVAATVTLQPAANIDDGEIYLGSLGGSAAFANINMSVLRYSDKVRTASEALAFHNWASDTSSYYIDADAGSDTTNGRSIITALASFDSINTAGITLDPNDNVYLRTDDTWREKPVFPSSGTSGNVITFGKYDSTGESGAKPIIDSTGTLIDFNSQDYIVLENLELRNGLVQINTGTNNIIRYCEFDSADANALLLDGTSNSVYYNLFLNATGDAIEVDSVSNTIYNNVIYANDTGIDVDTTVTIQNNIINTSTTDDINIVSTSTVTGGYNIFEDAARAGTGTYSGTSQWSTDPLFTDATALDFTLTPTSPAIDVGILWTGHPLRDYRNNTVPFPVGGLPDIGAYEDETSRGYENRFKNFFNFNKSKRE